MPSPKREHFRRVFTDWTFLGAVVVTIALFVSIAIGRIAPSITLEGILLAFMIIALVLLYARILEVLDESKSCRTDMLSEIKKIQIESRNASVSQTLPVISMEAFAQLESQLADGDSVLVFANTLEVDHQPMFEAVTGNLNKGVAYKYILFKEEQIDDWEKFIRLLRKRGVTNLPEAVFENSRTAALLRSSTAIYDYEDNNRAPEGFCVLETTDIFDTCVMLSPAVAKQTRDNFMKVWRSLSGTNRIENAVAERDASSKRKEHRH